VLSHVFNQFKELFRSAKASAAPFTVLSFSSAAASLSLALSSAMHSLSHGNFAAPL
jgi:hypothetical protein